MWSYSATKVVSMLRKGDVSPGELLTVIEERIAEVDRFINAIPTLCFERARQHILEFEKRPFDERGILAGLPVPIKDSLPVQGVRTTFGSTVFEKHIPEISDASVKILERNGGVVYGKTNTPELEAGANTFNDVFGATLNPWNTTLSSGGSSGGAAAAVASGMAWCAVGADFACSLRNPASLCGVVGLRPSPGLVPQGPNRTPYQNLSVVGPIARSVRDVALLLDALVGFDPIDPLSNYPNETLYTAKIDHWQQFPKIAFSSNLGISPVDTEVENLCRKSADIIAVGGMAIEEAYPNLRDAHETFRVLRAFQFAMAWGHLLPEHKDSLKPELVWNIEQGMSLTSEEIIQAEWSRNKMRQAFLTFMEDYDFLITPTSIVSAYPMTQRFPEQCNGYKFENYLQWMSISYAITLMSCPAISIPCGYTSDGRPVGLQIIGKPKTETQLLGFANKLESMLSIVPETPIEPHIQMA